MSKQKKQIAPPFIGISEPIKRVKELIAHVADTGLNIVITGETGVGKEVVAQNLYHHSPRVGKPFVKVNCAALPDGLLESELYGYERGAFTGADKKKRGKFELSSEGVLFLDEIGDMSMPLQSKLLHVLQSGEFAPLGSERDLKTNSWVIAATNNDLEENIQKKLFREDLYYRLNIIKIEIPPLRDRPEDIMPLIDYFLEKYTPQYKCANISKPNNGELERLNQYHWPGNVRQLQNTLKRMIVLGNWGEIIEKLNHVNHQPAMVPDGIKYPTKAPSVLTDYLDISNSFDDTDEFSFKKIKKKAMNKVEREIISYVLDKTSWNRTKASKILKISYKTLLYKISDLELKPSSKY